MRLQSKTELTKEHSPMKRIDRTLRQAFTLVSAGLASLSNFVYAQGLTVLDTTATNIETILDNIGIIIVTIAVFIAGGLILFRAVGYEVAFRIVVGGAVMGAAAEIAAFFYNAA